MKHVLPRLFKPVNPGVVLSRQGGGRGLEECEEFEEFEEFEECEECSGWGE